MTGEKSSRDDEHDYAVMEAALTESARGRWFLSEYARRHRGHDTQVLLDAIGRIEALGPERRAAPEPPPEPDRLEGELVELGRLVSDARKDLAAPPHGDPAGAPVDLARRIDAATSDVLDATERIQEAAWNLRERGADPAICDLLDQRATEIYAACAVQDGLTRQAAAVLKLVRILDARFAALRNRRTRAVPASTAQNGPATSAEPGESGLSAMTGQAAPMNGHPTTLAAIDALDAREKLRLFT